MYLDKSSEIPIYFNKNLVISRILHKQVHKTCKHLNTKCVKIETRKPTFSYVEF